MNDEGLIILTGFTFPDYWKIQRWLNDTEYGEQFGLVIFTGTSSQPCLEPKTLKAKFYWELKGSELRAETAKKLEQKILDFHKK